LNNGQAGILDLDLIQKQKVLGINASISVFHDYSVFSVDGKCREGQTPEQVRDLFLAEMEKVKKGDFADWLVGAAVKYLKLQDIKKVESNQGRAFTMLDAFITEQKWAEVNTKYDRMSKITKKELIDFAAKNFGANYVAIFKRQGEAKDIAKVDKPKITPVPLNKVDKSVFKAAFDDIKSEQLAPKFIDFKKDMKTGTLKNGVSFDYIKNPDNPTFELYYTVDMGSGNDKILPIAIKLLPYLGTSKYTPEQLQQEMFKLGISFNVFAGEDRTYVMLKGLEESFEKGTELFEHILANAKPDQKALEGVVDDVLKEREDAAKDKSQLRRALNNYGKFGPKSPFTNVLNTKELKALKAKDLTQKIKELTSFKHNVFYYGTKTQEAANAILSKNHKADGKKAVPKATEFAQQPTDQAQVFVVNFTDLPQAEISMISKDGSFEPKVAAQAALYNEYFGGDMSSIIFQEIRESRALAYSTWASYITPQFTDRAYYMQAYVGTQVDKLKEATNGVLDLVKNMPVQADRIEAARAAMLKRIKNERITKADIYWSIRNDKRMGYDHDSRKDVYEMGQKMTVEDVVKFQKDHIKDKNFVILVVGDRKKLDMKYLETLGKVTELSVQDVLGYDVHP
jgi:predicted Zn-dependent peptidase